jgi:hypothetical protein
MHRIAIPAHVRSVIDPDGAVLLDLRGGKYFSLNGVGSLIWTALESGASTPEIEASLNALPGAVPDQVRAELDAFLAHLRQSNLVEADA